MQYIVNRQPGAGETRFAIAFTETPDPIRAVLELAGYESMDDAVEYEDDPSLRELDAFELAENFFPYVELLEELDTDVYVLDATGEAYFIYDIEDEFERVLNEEYDTVNVAGLEWDAGRVLRTMDPTAFNMAVGQYVSDYYSESWEDFHEAYN